MEKFIFCGSPKPKNADKLRLPHENQVCQNLCYLAMSAGLPFTVIDSNIIRIPQAKGI